MNGDVEVEAPRPRPLSAGIWTLFSWLRRTDRSSSSESVSSVGSDRSVASFDFLAPLNYNHGNTPLVLPPNPLTETYKKRLQERSLQRQHDRDLTLRRKYGLFREEGLGYDAFSLPSARRLQKDTVLRQDRERRATSESIRRTAYVPGKRRAPLPPSVVVVATLPRNYKRKRPAPKPPVNLTEENKENISINKIVQMNTSAEIVNNTSISTELTLANKIEEQPKHETKEIKLRSDKSFLKQIFDSKKRNSAIDTSRIKLLPSISELDKQAAEIIEANKMLRASGRNSFTDNSSRPDSTEETWICTTCLRKYKPVVTCCIYCIIKENSNKNSKNVHINASNICTQTDQKDLKSNRSKGIDDKKKLREMLKEMKDSLPKRPKHNAKYPKDNDDTVKSTETPTLRIGSTIDENIKGNFNNINSNEKECRPSESKNTAKQTFFSSQPSSSKDFSIPFVGNNISEINRKSACKTSSPNISNANINVSTPDVVVKSVKKSPDSNSNLVKNTHETYSPNINKQTTNSLNDDRQSANGMHRAPDLRTINHNISLVPTQDNKAKKASNIQTNAISVNQTFIEVQKNPQNKNVPPLVVNTDLKKQGHRTENHENIEQSNTKTPISNNKQLAELKKCDSPGSDTKDEMKKAQLGNVLSSNIEIKSAGQGYINSSNNNLNTPLKVSSLLNPLYCPKYKTPNDRVADCSFGNIVSTKEENIKKHEISQTQPTILPEKVVTPTFVNVQTPSTSITKVVNDVLQKSESQHTEASKNNKSENPPAIVEGNQREQIAENVITDVKTDASSYVKVLDHHNRRRNLINQLEHAIAEGNEQLAAEAAANLAKLKIACSVLSFSSQIIAEPLSNKTAGIQNIKREENHYKLQAKHNSSSKIEDSRDMPATKKSEQQDKQKPVSANGEEVNILPEASASTSSQILDNQIPIELWVEDREAARGPIPLRISRKARMVELKRHVETSLGLDIRLQRWIVGRNLCTDDNTPLTALAGPDLNAPFYLCLVESETNKDNPQQIKDDKRIQIKAPNEINDPALSDVYTELMKLEQQAIVPNTEPFECGVCIEQCDVGAGVVLRECIHTFCRECLVDVIRHCEEPVVSCPAIQCPGALQEREIRAILSAEEYERWLARGLAAAESGTRNTFHCRTRDCKGWAFCEPGVRRFPCPVCRHTNCVPCQAVHEGETCEHYQMKLREAVTAAESNQTDQGTQALLASLIARGEALECPECSAIITKKWGCDWVKCSACKTEICWVTKGRRWGPGGKGDTSGGCRCGVDGQRCHPSCGYCH